MKYLAILLLTSTMLWSSSLEKVSLQLKWKYQFQFAGFIMAKEKGFYEKVKIDVDLREFDATQNVINEVLTGKSTFGIDDSQLIYYRLQNQPLVGLMGIFQTSPVVFLALQDSNFTKIQDLDGKKLEITDNSTYNISTRALLRAFNIETSQESPTFKLNNLIKRKVDIIVAYDANEPYLLRQQGYDSSIFNPKNYGFDFYGDILFTNEKTIQDNPKMVKNFHDASKKGWEYAFNNIDETINVILKKYNTQNKNRTALEYEAKTLKQHSQFSKNFSYLNQDKIDAIAKSFAILFPKRYDMSVLDNFIYEHNEGLLNKRIDYTLLIQLSTIFLFILSIITFWLRLLKKHNFELQAMQDKLSILNNTLEEKVKEEVEKNRKQELIIIQQSRLVEMGQTINMIAHQWRQPLSNINTLVMLIEMKIENEALENKELFDNELKDIESITAYMSQTIDDFRSFFKPEKTKSSFSVKEQIEHALRMVKPIFTHRDIQLKINNNQELMLLGYPNEFGQMIINLLNNAKDALLENNVHKEKNIYLNVMKKEGKAIIIIYDNAGGIDEKIIDNIFDPYFSTKTKKQGTGLGLYMSKMIVEEHMQGHLSVMNSQNGAMFTIEFSLN